MPQQQELLLLHFPAKDEGQNGEEILAETQGTSRANRSTIDQIFTLRKLAERYEEFGKDLYVDYIDFRKAFNSIWREGLRETMRL